jgi:hypothetical protein
MTHPFPRLSLAAALCLMPLAVHAAAAHVHGAAMLAIAIEGGTLTLMLESPTDSLVGFEHAPRTARERAAVTKMKQTLERPAALFVPTPAAACKPVGVKLESTLFESGHAHHDHGAHAHAGGHADLDGAFVFRCARPEALRDLEVRLFDAFPRLKKLKVEIAGPRGQTAAQLTPGQRKARW